MSGIHVDIALWELLRLGRGIPPDGQRPSEKTNGGRDGAFNTLFSETGPGEHVPRAVFVDLEPTVVDGVRTVTCWQALHSEQPTSGKQGRRRHFARRHNTNGRETARLSLNAPPL